MPLTFFSRIWSIPVNLFIRVRFYLTWSVLLLNAFQQRIHLFIAERFRQYGFFAARHPYSLILFSIVVFLITSYPLTEIPLTEYPPLEFVESSFTMKLPTPTWFYGESASVAVLLPISVSLTFQPRITVRARGTTADGSGSTCSPIRTTALAADRLIATLRSTTSLPMPYDDTCYRLHSSNDQGHDVKEENPTFLPQIGECFLTAPLTSFESYKQIVQLFDERGATSLPSNMTLSDPGLDLMFGVPFSATGLQALYSSSSNGKHVRHLCASAVGHSVHFVAFAFFAPGRNATPLSATPNLPLTSAIQANWLNLQEELLHSISDSEAADEPFVTGSDDTAGVYRPAFLYFRSWNWMEFFPILVIYCALLGYIYFSLTKIAMVKSKVGLAFGAVFGIAASFLVATGICTRLGLTNGYFFTVTDIFPYVVVLNGLENIVVMTTAVTNCRREFKCDVPHCIAMGLEMEGFRMVKHVVLAAFVSIIGVLTGVPQIRDFFLMALIGLCTDLLFQLVFFSAVLAIDIKRIELEEQCRGQLQQHRRQRSAGDEITATEVASNNSVSLLTWPWSIIPTSSPFGLIEGGKALGLSSSLAWLHSRRVSSLLSVFAILFITLLYLESYKSGFYYQLIVTPVADSISWLVKPIKTPESNDSSSTVIESPVLTAPVASSPEVSPASEWWRKLPRGHFQKLFSAAYGMSLTHRYLTILSPMELHAHVPLELAESSKKDDSLLSTPVFPSTPPSTPISQHVGNDDTISSHVLVVILVILSLSVIVNMSLLVYTCLRRRFRPKNHRQQFLNSRRPSQFSSALDFVTAHKQPAHVLRVTPVVTLNNFVTAISSRLTVSSTPNQETPRTPGEGGKCSLVVAHTADGLLTIIDPDLGEIQGQNMRPIASHMSLNGTALKPPDKTEHTFPCWALGAARDVLYVSGAGSGVELYALVRGGGEGGGSNSSLCLSFRGVYSSSVSNSSVQNVINLPGDALFALTFADGCVDVIYHNNNSSNNKEPPQFSNIYTLRMRPPLFSAASSNLLALGSGDGCVRVLYISQRQASVANCATIYIPPPKDANSAQADEISAIAVDSTEPAIVAVGTSSGRLFLYELTPKSDVVSTGTSSSSHILLTASPSPDSSTLATANLTFSGTLPRPMPTSFSLLTASHASTQIISGISRLVIDANICVAVNAAGSLCAVNRRRNPAVIVGTIHPNPVVSISVPMAPVLDVAIIPSLLRTDLLSSPSGCGPNSSLFASAHSDGRIMLWAVRDQFPSPAGSLFCVATAQSPVLSWPIERLYVVENQQQQASSSTNSQLIFSVRNKICRVDIPTNISYT